MSPKRRRAEAGRRRIDGRSREPAQKSRWRMPRRTRARSCARVRGDRARPPGAAARPPVPEPPWPETVMAQRFRDLVADRHQRVEVRRRILKIDADLAPAHPRISSSAVMSWPSRRMAPSAMRKQADDRAAGERFARTALAEPNTSPSPSGHPRRAACAPESRPRLRFSTRRMSSITPEPSFSPSRRRKAEAREATMAMPGKVVIHQAVKMKFCPSRDHHAPRAIDRARDN